jgi:hypothetical protein
MPKKFNPKNGQDVVEYVKNKPGVEIHQKKNGMVSIKTSKGSMQVQDNRTNYSEVDKGNVRRWLRILGLLSLVLIPLAFWINHVIAIRGGY